MLPWLQLPLVQVPEVPDNELCFSQSLQSDEMFGLRIGSQALNGKSAQYMSGQYPSGSHSSVVGTLPQHPGPYGQNDVEYAMACVPQKRQKIMREMSTSLLHRVISSITVILQFFSAPSYTLGTGTG